MIFWLMGAFVFGIIVPYIARRFAKFMPATFAGAIFELFRHEKKISAIRQTKLYQKFLWRSLLIGLFNTCLTFVLLLQFPDSFLIVFYAWILLLLAEIDWRTFILPDILTIPLLLIGLFGACSNNGIITVDESVYGALVGYFLPVVVSLIIVWYKKDAFGGGDIKLLSALGAWLGIQGIIYTITTAALLGLLWAGLRRKRSIAFGPMLAIAGIVVMIFSGY